MVWGVCISGLSSATNTLTSMQAQVRLNANNSDQFRSNTMVSNVPGCVVPNHQRSWETGMVTSMQKGIVAPGSCQVSTGILPSQTGFKGIQIQCSRPEGFYPVRGYEGTNICINGASTAVFPPREGSTADYWASPANWQAATNGGTPMINMSPNFNDDNNRLLCASGCRLPESVCRNGNWQANIWGTANQWNKATCTLLPVLDSAPLNANEVATGAMQMHAPWAQWTCKAGLGNAPVWTARCAAPAGQTASTLAVTPQYNGDCGGDDGAMSGFMWGDDDGAYWNNLETQQQERGAIRNFPEVTSTLGVAFPVVPGSAYASVWQKRYWNNHPAQGLRPGSAFLTRIEGCQPFVGAERTRCVQQTLNYWRCRTKTNTNCAGYNCWESFSTPIACPTHQLGFRCNNRSKKGLLGLLGLLGLIPLCLLCCCLFWLCCIRRRKTEADVHFATFDPHAAPIATSQMCTAAPIATALPTFGATPYAASAIPCL